MTDLSGVFETDLELPDALTACVDGLDSLGWEIETVESHRVLSHAGNGNGASPTVEIELADSRGGTDIRIAGADSEQTPVGEDEIADLLDRARDAIGEQIERIPEPDDYYEDEHPEPEPSSERPTEVWAPVAEPSYEGEPVADEAAPPQRPRREDEEQPGWWDRNKRYVAVGIVVFCIGGAIGAGAAGGGESKTVTRVKTKTQQGKVQVRTTTDVSTVTSTVSTVVATPPQSTSPSSSAAQGGTAASGGAASPSGNCDPSYAPQCLDPNASDYDCLGGGGDGPRFVQGPVTVVGDDHFGLDTSDNDGVGCE